MAVSLRTQIEVFLTLVVLPRTIAGLNKHRLELKKL